MADVAVGGFVSNNICVDGGGKAGGEGVLGLGWGQGATTAATVVSFIGISNQ